MVDALDGLEADARERARTIDRLRFELDEIERAHLDVDRDASLDAELEVLEHAEELQLAAAEAGAALGEDGAADPLGVAVAALRKVHVEDPALDELRQRAVALAAEATELASDLRVYGESVEADPEHLEGLRAPTAADPDAPAQVRRRCRGHRRVRPAGRRPSSCRSRTPRPTPRRSRTASRELEVELRGLAEDLRRGRTAAAGQLAVAVDGHLADLGMPHARFAVEVVPTEDDRLGADGGDQVTFTLAANPGEPARPLATAASGGERSRVSLAVEVALADVDDAAVLVFDEVDAGIGGATAMAVGEKLARLAARGAAAGGRQVVCVTHLAQLAAFADVHHVVEKGLRGGRTVTTTRLVEEADRAGELSRMLGGDATREVGIEHARELLSEAGRRRAS